MDWFLQLTGFETTSKIAHSWTNKLWPQFPLVLYITFTWLFLNYFILFSGNFPFGFPIFGTDRLFSKTRVILTCLLHFTKYFLAICLIFEPLSQYFISRLLAKQIYFVRVKLYLVIFQKWLLSRTKVLLIKSCGWLFLKFIYSEKATNFCKISNVDLSYIVTVKSTVEIWQNFVAFSEYMNFTK